MIGVINPKVEVVSYGPELHLKEGGVITPDEFVYGAANITYKDIGALKELIELKKTDADIKNKVKKMLIKVGGSGHASMATTPGFWVFIEGNPSKLVDSIFTTAKFGSSLMPSGRRVPITKEAIVIPKGISEKGKELIDLYLQRSEKNIQVYEVLQEKGVPKEEASKIVQYGHRGGGFMFMPLETLIHFSKLAERDFDSMPQEGHEIISQLENFINGHGAGTIYHARKNAPRTGSPHPNIFHNRTNEASELMEQNSLNYPLIISCQDSLNSERAERINKYIKERSKVFSSTESINKNWMNLLGDLEDIVSDFNNTINVKIFTNTPWRVWGEVKRHRTMPQTAESVYRAVDRAGKKIKEMGILDSDGRLDYFKNPNLLNQIEEIVSLPHSVKNNSENLVAWAESFLSSIETYQRLVYYGNIKKSDAITIIPRGLKLGVVKNFDLYNLTTGYISLRLCGTAEPEMKKITEIESKLLLENPAVGEDVKKLIAPKCNYVGFCPEIDYQGKKCVKVNKMIKEYNEELHKELQKNRIKYIEEKINDQQP